MITFFNKKYINFILLQRTRLKTEYNISSESSEDEILQALNQMTKKDLDLIEPFLPTVNKQNKLKILDIGCGLSTINVFIAKKYKNCHFYLQDKSESIDVSKKYNGFNTKYYYYNNLDLLEEFLIKNIVTNYSIINGDEIFNINENFDIIMSLLSCGWHYSLTTYLDFIKKHLTKTGILVIDVRNNTEEELLYKTFHNVYRIFNKNEKKHDGDIVGYRYICSLLKQND